MRVMTCFELAEAEAELALDLLDGEARGAALAHVEHCAGCRARVAQATDAVDMLLQLTPDAEPPRGFETRVLAHLAALEQRPRRPRRSRRRRALPVLCAALTVAVVAAATLLLPAVRRTQDTAAFASTTMRTPTGQEVGVASIPADRPGWIMLSIPGWQRELAARYDAGHSYSVRIERVDGTWIEIARPVGADGTWITALDPASTRVDAIRVVDDQGRVWCSGRFVR
jgi:hypothetical protein